MESIGTNTSAHSIELAWGGKLPSMGDFIWSNGRTPLRLQLDNWLMTGMQQIRSTLSDSWESSFDQAPMWNFIVPANVLGPECVAGCISPSCDRIGRRFPFAITYGLSARHLSKVMDTVPGLLSQTGFLLFHSIRRQWPRETLVTLLDQALLNWKASVLPAERKDSVIFNVLAKEDDSTHSDTATIAFDRFSSLPWSNVEDSLIVGSTTSFWWTNGAGGAALKAFTYGTRLDGALMTWLFGHSSV
jgi:type VI secretion system protein ImpM